MLRFLPVLAGLLSACASNSAVSSSSPPPPPPVEPGTRHVEGWVGSQMDCSRGPPGMNACGGPLLILPFEDVRSPIRVGNVLCVGSDATESPSLRKQLESEGKEVGQASCKAPDGTSYPVRTPLRFVLRLKDDAWVSWHSTQTAVTPPWHRDAEQVAQ